MKNGYSFIIFVVLVLVLSACSGNNGRSELETPTPASTPASGYSTGGKVGNHASLFPVPTNVYNYMVLNENTLNFNTSLNFEEIISFYTEEFDKAGYTVREDATEINDVNFTVVWDGHDSGRAILVQGLDLKNGSYNIVVKFVEM